jgi:hypothetical protein
MAVQMRLGADGGDDGTRSCTHMTVHANVRSTEPQSIWDKAVEDELAATASTRHKILQQLHNTSRFKRMTLFEIARNPLRKHARK